MRDHVRYRAAAIALGEAGTGDRGARMGRLRQRLRAAEQGRRASFRLRLGSRRVVSRPHKIDSDKFGASRGLPRRVQRAGPRRLGDSPSPLPSSITLQPRCRRPSSRRRELFYYRRCRRRQRTLSYARLLPREGRGTSGRILFPTALAGRKARASCPCGDAAASPGAAGLAAASTRRCSERVPEPSRCR
jgi:hypothetical protein